MSAEVDSLFGPPKGPKDFHIDIIHASGDVLAVGATGIGGGRLPDGGLSLALNTEKPGGTKVRVRLSERQARGLIDRLSQLFPPPAADQKDIP